jgi:serine/threonine protein kinase
MTESEKSILFSCREIAVMEPDRGTTLVQHEPTRRIYVKKELPARSAGVYRWLRHHYIEGVPEVVEVVNVPVATIPGEAGKTRESGQPVNSTSVSRLTESPFSSIEYALEEYVSGQTLREILGNGNLFPVEEAVDIMEQLCRTLQALGNARPPITGCDLDPANIILTSDGLVRIRDLRSAGQTFGQTFSDMSDNPLPPVSKTGRARRSKVGNTDFSNGHVKSLQTDLRALGGLFCQLITGHLPGNELPGGKPGQIIRRCMESHPSKQYPDLQGLLRDLDACRPHPTVDHSITSDSDAADAAPRKHPCLLPGFRSGNPLHVLAALFAYILLIWLSLTFTLDKFPPGWQMWVERLVFFLCGSVILLFTGNYMDVWRHLRITKIRTTLLRLLVVLIIDAALFMLSILAIIFTGLALGVYHSSLF